MNDYDVAIVGAGPAGAVLASLLSPKFRVALLDKRIFTDEARLYNKEKCCGGLLDKRAQKAMASLGIVLPKECLVGPQVFVLRGIDLDNGGATRYYQRQYVNIDRVRFDGYLVGRALQNENVTLFEDTTVYACRDTFAGTVLKLRSGSGEQKELTADYVVGAGGATSWLRTQVRKSLGKKERLKRYVSIQKWFRYDREMPLFTAVFDKNVTDYYSWLIPENGSVLAGAALRADAQAQKKYRIFLEDLKKLGFEFGEEQKTRGAVILRPRACGCVLSGAGRILLLGEAAGLISPSSCEGISFALTSAMALARVLNQAGTDDVARIQKKYKRALAPMRRVIFAKSLKSPIMYTPFWRGLVFKSGALSMKMYQ